ncbi:MAG: DcaP family trimeric outer membrane transporter, partial [Pseudomonadota bacterium]
MPKAIVIGVIIAYLPLALANDKDREIELLREEVKELRELVDKLLYLQGVSTTSTSSAENNHQSEEFNPEDKNVKDIPVVTSSTVTKTQRDQAISTATEIDSSSRQPIGRFPDDAFVTAGQFDRSISVPNTGGAFRVGGAIQVNSSYDIDNLGFQQIGTPPTIPLNGSIDDDEQQFAIHARHSRVNFDYRAPTDYGNFRTFVEFDFFGDGDEFTNDYDLRLRHAMAEWGPWKVGQFWSGFVDVFSFPETADPGGPLAAPVLRAPGIYYVQGEQEKSNWGIGIENPAGDLGGRTDLIASEDLPNIVAFSRL